MKRNDVLLALLVVVLAVAVILGPAIYSEWRDKSEPAERAATVEPAANGTVGSEPAAGQAALDEAAEVERVTGMLMLYQACANRIDGFDSQGRAVFEAWKSHHAATLEKRGTELDFHIVLADPEGLENGSDAARAEERELCERNLTAMREELEPSAQ